jgi:hypothetical protein
MAADSEKSSKAKVDNGPNQPEIFRDRAEDVIPEWDADNKAYKKQILADSPAAEAKAQASRVEGQPAAEATPSGHALVETAGIADDEERGAEYERVKRARRWGY